MMMKMMNHHFHVLFLILLCKLNNKKRIYDNVLFSLYFRKEAAGVISVPFQSSSNEQETAVLHVFPPCQFSKKVLRVVCPSMSFSNGPRTPPSRPTIDEHLMVVIVHND